MSRAESTSGRPAGPAGHSRLGATGGSGRRVRRLLSRGLRSPAGRRALGAAGVATSAFLVMSLLASYRGVAAGVASYTGQEAVDLWVAPRGTDNLIRSSALLDPRAVERIRRLPGVSSAGAILRGFATVASSPDADAPSITLLVLAYEAPEGLGGPPRWALGRPPSGPAEVAVDRAAAWRLGLAVGDSLWLNGQGLVVVGLSSGTNLLGTQIAFLDLAAAPFMTGQSGPVSFLAIGTSESPGVVARRISQSEPRVEAHDRRAFVRRNLEEVGAGFRPMQLMISVLGAGTAMIVVMLLVQTVVADRRNELAVLLALGAPVRGLCGVLALHAAGLTAAGALLGGLLTLLLARVLYRWAPVIELAVEPVDLAAVALSLTISGVIAAAIPLLRLRHVDPVEAFRP